MKLQSATFETGITKIRQAIENDDRFSGLKIETTNIPYDTMVFNQCNDGHWEMIKIVLSKYADGFMAGQFLADVHIEDTTTGGGYDTTYAGKPDTASSNKLPIGSTFNIRWSFCYV